MTAHTLPPQLADFVCEHLHSIEQLEVVLLLLRNKESSWTARRAALELQIAEPNAASALRQLADRGILECSEQLEPTFRYAPASVKVAQSLDELLAMYPQSRLEIVIWISRCAMDRIRNAHVRAFAQAFLLKKPKDGR